MKSEREAAPGDTGSPDTRSASTGAGPAGQGRTTALGRLQAETSQKTKDRSRQAMTDLKGRTALVTGSTSGIGRATAITLAARGARVLVTGRNEQRAAVVVAEIERGGGTAAYHLTALDGAGPARDLAAWAAKAGDGHVDILVNNTGVALPGPTESATEAEFDQTFTINVKVPFFLVAALAPAMAARGPGHVRGKPRRPRTADQGLGRRIRSPGRPGQRGRPRPHADPDERRIRRHARPVRSTGTRRPRRRARGDRRRDRLPRQRRRQLHPRRHHPRRRRPHRHLNAGSRRSDIIRSHADYRRAASR